MITISYLNSEHLHFFPDFLHLCISICTHNYAMPAHKVGKLCSQLCWCIFECFYAALYEHFILNYTFLFFFFFFFVHSQCTKPFPPPSTLCKASLKRAVVGTRRWMTSDISVWKRGKTWKCRAGIFLFKITYSRKPKKRKNLDSKSNLKTISALKIPYSCPEEKIDIKTLNSIKQTMLMPFCKWRSSTFHMLDTPNERW